MAVTAPTLTISGLGSVSDPIFINNSVRAANGVPPGILVSLSPGAVLNYIVEMTGDPNDASGYPSPGNWSEMVEFRATGDNYQSKALGLKFMVRAIRIRLNSWTSGTATIAVVQA